ncbi:GTP pyrophosphokinase family protein [Liquorilactobacillus satsumensis]|nr:GTP pyrophosphokinase [Liquorilactobacillus satsumensis]MCC7667155.1 GTP pyrophosphokinase [Liquorilactobacillus satsumensis]MCP9312491.1 GTP pyrophosphokinase family protein [Liquorilactobacillus satsumensis]MCP9329078.1 GTP pyrophosphokinase family protein [Liquorilactobacillus satsumensis]MCP9357748.1 GTP pyrophosphokinase family protein [Liquorilactobacillus satsumensis]MCP9359781.1 GTP pyrophosphokinase family protein [Liquorilactobacillus satsumensis]
MEIYGEFKPYLTKIRDDVLGKLNALNQKEIANNKTKLYEHLIGRVKTEESMTEKCQRKGFPLSPQGALYDCKDAIGVRIVCNFIDDVYRAIELLKAADWCTVVKEKDYITHSKPNGYRSYHLILKVATSYPAIAEATPGGYFVEVQLRTIAMDSWASLEHEMKYKHTIENSKQIVKELKRCADQLASCDVQMQTIRQLIHENH